jgi:hypothetical protein
LKKFEVTVEEALQFAQFDAEIRCIISFSVSSVKRSREWSEGSHRASPRSLRFGLPVVAALGFEIDILEKKPRDLKWVFCKYQLFFLSDQTAGRQMDRNLNFHKISRLRGKFQQ